MSSVNGDNFTLLFIWMPFYFILLPNYPARTLVQNCIGVARTDILVLCLMLGGKAFSFLPLSMMLAMHFCRCPLSGWGSSLYSQFVECFYHKEVLNVLSCLFCMHWQKIFFLCISSVVFFLHVLTWYDFFFLYSIDVYYIHWFSAVKPTLHFWINPS